VLEVSFFEFTGKDRAKKSGINYFGGLSKRGVLEVSEVETPCAKVVHYKNLASAPGGAPVIGGFNGDGTRVKVSR
jgi:hypothetical protein